MKQLLVFAATAVLALPVYAQDPAPATTSAPPALDPILVKLMENLPKLAHTKWEGAHTFSAKQGEAGSMAGTLAVTFQDVKHFKFVLDMSANPGAEAVAAGAAVQEIDATLIGDGTHLWVISPMIGQMMGGMEGIKVEIALFEKLIPQMMGQFGGGTDPNSPPDLHKMIQGAMGGFTLKEEGSTPELNRYTFEGDGWKGFAQFDTKSWFPMAVQMGSEAEGGQINFNTTAFSLKESFPENTFTATGLDATKIMDITGLIQSQLGAMGGGGDEDLEF